MQKMPIAAKLLAGRRSGYMGHALEGVERAVSMNRPLEETIPVREVEHESHTAIMRSLREAVPFDVQAASELYWGRPKEYYRIDRDFGPMMLPYDSVWFEWVIPQDHYIGGELIRSDEPPAQMAAFIYQDEGPDEGMPRGVRYSLTAQLLCYSTGMDRQPHLDERPVLVNEVAVRWGIDAAGLYVDGSLMEISPMHLTPGVREQLVREAKTNVFVAAMALNLINCKNVTTVQAGAIQQRRSGTEKRRGVQPIRYRTIVLPGMTVERSYASRGLQHANRDKMAHHMVRGHFKTFTKDAPLLGKHVGTYWWGWNTRGSKTNGEVKQDYRIEEQV